MRKATCPYVTVARLVAHHQIFLPWLTRDHVNNHLRKLNKLGRSTNRAVSPCALSDPSFPSSLSTLTPPHKDTLSLLALVQLRPNSSGMVEEALISGQCVATTPKETASTTRTASMTLLTYSNLGGRRIQAILRLDRTVDGQRAPPFLLHKISRKDWQLRVSRQQFVILRPARRQNHMALACQKVHLPRSLPIVGPRILYQSTGEIYPATIRGRRYNDIFQVHITMGPTTLMAEIEPYLCHLIEQLQKMRVPINSKQGLQLANSLIKGTSTLVCVNEWRLRSCAAFQDFGKEELGESYWNGFKGRIRTFGQGKSSCQIWWQTTQVVHSPEFWINVQGNLQGNGSWRNCQQTWRACVAIRVRRHCWKWNRGLWIENEVQHDPCKQTPLCWWSWKQHFPNKGWKGWGWEVSYNQGRTTATKSGNQRCALYCLGVHCSEWRCCNVRCHFFHQGNGCIMGPGSWSLCPMGWRWSELYFKPWSWNAISDGTNLRICWERNRNFLLLLRKWVNYRQTLGWHVLVYGQV